MESRMKRLLSFLLAAALVLSMIVPVTNDKPVQAAVEATEETFMPDETVTSAVPSAAKEKIQKAATIRAEAATLDFSGNYCPACGPDVEVTWVKLTRAYIGSNNDNGATPHWTDAHPHFYWDPDDFTNSTASYAYMNWLQNVKSASMCIHLNGMRFENIYSRIHWGGGTLNIMGEGTFINSGAADKQAYGVFQMGGGTVNLYGGTFISTGTGLVKPTHKTSYYATVGLNNANAVFNMYDGTVLAVNEKDSQGANVAMTYGTFNMYGGEIRGGKGYPYYDSSVKTTGTTEAIKASYNSFEIAGGNVFMRYSTAKFNMYGGKITGGTATYGGNVAMYESAAFTQYAGEISGGEATTTIDGHGGGNVKVREGTFTQNGGVIKNGTAKNGGNIDTRSKVYIKGLVMDGHATSGANIFAASGCKAYIQDGGRVLRSENASNIMVYGSGNLYMEGGLLYGGNARTHGGNIYMSGDGHLVMSGGVIRDGISPGTGGNIFSQNKDSSIVISGGQILNGVAATNGGNIRTTQGQLTISGGTISGGKAGELGGNIYYEATTASTDTVKYGEYMLQITGGTITDGEAGINGGNIYAKGSANRTMGIDNAVISDGVSAGAGGNIYTSGINVNIGANAEILNGISNSTDYSGGGNIAFSGAKVLTTAGKIMGGRTTGAGGGGNISVLASAKLVMNGGVIANGRVEGNTYTSWGGNIRAYNCDVTINDGLIYGGYCLRNTEQANVAVLTGESTAGADLTITGGVIVGCVNTSPASTYTKDGETKNCPATKIVLSGNTKIVKYWKLDDNTTVESSLSGLRIVSGNTADVSGLTEGASVCVFGTEAGQALTKACDNLNNVKGYIWAENKDYCITESEKQLYYNNHTKADPKVENLKEATLNAPGSYEEVVYCSVCSIELSRETKTIDQLTGAKASIDGYFYETLEEAVAAAKAGEKVELEADVTLTSAINVPADAKLDLNGHMLTINTTTVAKRSANTPDFFDYLSGTVLINGGKLVVDGTSFIGAENCAYLTDNAELVIQDEHITISQGTVKVAASLPSLPSKTLTVAENATLVIPENVTLNVNGVLNANGTIENNGAIVLTEATATVKTTTELEVKTSAGDTVKYTEGAYGVHNHQKVTDAAKAPTCEETGLTEGVHCETCGDVLTPQKPVDALGHKYNEKVTTEPSCTEVGEKTFTCATCGDTYTEEIKATGHTMKLVSAAVPATCLVPGKTAVYTCTVCQCYFEDAEGKKGLDSATPDLVMPNGHELTEVAATDATCEANGNVKHYLCSVCGNAYAENNMFAAEAIETVIPKLGHSFTNYIYNNDATFQADGTETATCDNGCGTTDTRAAAGTQLTGTVKIGDKGYEDLKAALSAAEAGDTIVLLADQKVTEILKIEKAITIDLGGNTVEGTAKKVFEVYANATIKNGSIIGANRCVDTRKAVELTLDGVNLTAEKYTSAFQNPQPLTIGGSENGTQVNMTNVTINAGTQGYGIITFVKTELKATNSTVSGYGALYVKSGSEGSEFTFENSTLTGTNKGNDVEGNAFSAIAVRADDVTVAMDASSKLIADGNYMYALSLGSTYAGEESAKGATITLLGDINGKLLASTNVQANTIILPAAKAEALAEAGYAYVDNGDGTVTVANAIAAIDGKGYASLAEAIAAAEAGQTVTLLKSVKIDAVQKIEKAITIDLGGNTVEGTAKKVFEVYANATIKNGSIVGANRCVDTRKAVELTLDGVNLTAEKYTSAFQNPQPLTIGGAENGTKVNMTNVTINAGTQGYGIITFVETELKATNSTISGYGALYVKSGSEGSEFTFEGSTLTGTNKGNDVEGNAFSAIAVRADDVTVAMDASSKLTADGNYMYALSLGSNYAGEEAVKGANITVLGTITGNLLAEANEKDNTIILPAAKAEALAEAGYAYVDNGDGTVTVANAVAAIGEKGYATLQAAIDAVQNGDTIVLLADNEEYTIINQQKNVAFTIDGAGKTFTGSVIINGTSYAKDQGQGITFRNVNFLAPYGWHTFIETTDYTYARNITIDDCTFNGGADGYAYGIHTRHAYNLVITDTTATNMYELVNASHALTGLTVENVTVTNTVYGFWMVYGSNLSFKNVEIRNASDTGIYIRNNSGSTATFENVTIVADQHGVVLEGVAEKNSQLVFNGTNDIQGADGNIQLRAVEGVAAQLTATIHDAGITDADFVGSEAKIGNVYYNTLENALAAEGETVSLVTDVTRASVTTGSKTIDLNGKTLTADVYGNLAVNGGMLVTPQGYKMIGAGADYYESADAVLTMAGPTGDITLISGTVTLAQSWWTGAEQTLTIGADATFVIPENVTMNILSTVIVEGDLTVNGTANLYTTEATVKAAEGLNITTTAAETVLYADGVYSTHNHSWDEGVYTEPTYYEDGYTTYTCTACGETKVEVEEGTMIPAVAQIGSVKYGTLVEAANAAQNGDTILLLKDTTETKKVVLSKNVTLDGNGFTLTANINSKTAADNRAIELTAAGSNVTIKDLTIVCEGKTERAINVTNANITLLVEGVTVPFAKYAVNMITAAKNVRLTIRNSNITGFAAINTYSDNGEITVENSVLTGDGRYNNNTFSTIAIIANNSKLTVTGGKIVAKVTVDDPRSSHRILQIGNSSTKRAGNQILLDTELEYTEKGIFLSVHLPNNTVTLRDDYAKQVLNEKYLYTDNKDGTITLAPYAPSGVVDYRADVTDKATREGIAVTMKDVVALESLVVKVYCGDTLMFVSTRRAFDRDDEQKALFPVLNARTTANIVLWGDVSGSWDNEILVAPTELNVPDKIEVWADGVLTDTYTNAAGTVLGVNLEKYLALECVADIVATNTTTGASYLSLTEAIAEANEGETVLLLQSVEMADILTLDKAITLDGNNNTLKSTAARAINVDCAGEVTIQNLTIECSSATQRAVNVINQTATLKLDNVTVPYATYAVNVAASAGAAKVEIANSNITGYAALNITAENASATVKDSTLTGNGIAGEPNAFATIAIQANGVQVTVEGGKLVAAEDANESILQINSGYTGAVVVLDAELVYTESGIVGQIDSKNNLITLRDEYADTIISDGYVYEQNAQNAELIDIKDLIVAYNKDTDKYYTNLTDGLDELYTGETLLLMVDLMEEGSLTVWEGNLDLNGHTLKARALSAPFQGANVIDSSEDNAGLLIVEEKRLALYIENVQLPVKTPEGYKFLDVKVRERLSYSASADKHTFGIGMYDDGTDLLLAELLSKYGVEGTHIQLRVRVEWVGTSGNVVYQDFRYRDDMIKNTMGNCANAGSYKYGINMELFGAKGLEDLKFTAYVVALDSRGNEIVEIFGTRLDG